MRKQLAVVSAIKLFQGDQLLPNFAKNAYLDPVATGVTAMTESQPEASSSRHCNKYPTPATIFFLSKISSNSPQSVSSATSWPTLKFSVDPLTDPQGRRIWRNIAHATVFGSVGASVMEVTKDPNSNPGRLDDSDPELELYTIPSSSRWFAWDEIHETERTAFKEFFDASSISRTPKIYKEYRDFIINKYREEPSRRLTFTEVRKSLVGDVTFLHKAFHFLENWGLINYGAPSAAAAEKEEEEEEPCKVRLEEGTPNGIRVAATPNSLKPMLVPRGAKTGGNATGASLKLPPLASYSDIYGDLIRQKEGNCGLCGGKCGSGHYRCTQDNFIICANCFKSGNYGEKRFAEDFVLSESSENSGKHDTVWTEGEILLLLESVLKHGDDWELVAQSVQTKTKLDCISKLIELPFGELMLGPALNVSGANGIVVNNANQVQSSSSDCQEISKTKDQPPELTNENEQNGDAVKESPSKRQRVTPLSDSSGSLMNQVGLISNVVDPHITAAAADAAVSALCDENLCPREIFDAEEDSARDLEGEGLEMERSSISGRAMVSSCSLSDEGLRQYLVMGYYKDLDGIELLEVKFFNWLSHKTKALQVYLHRPKTPKTEIPLPLRVRAATATALGAAAARAKLLADQEVREIEHLVATIIEAQIDKLLHKVKHFDDLELLMEKEHTEMEKLKDSILTERIDVLRRTFRSGITRWKDYSYVKS
ncbi:hypothetical protein V8G54_005798 [Vigna mungo]|uniref:SWI/SNF complex subunit SWI3A n=1 Tax=Vigna mungo TaxID=3915 RepID=A0AAQ3NXS8_VIGMU